MKACSVSGCGRLSRRSNGLCDTHNQRQIAGLSLDAPIQRRRRDKWGALKASADAYGKAASTRELLAAERRLALAAMEWAWDERTKWTPEAA